MGGGQSSNSRVAMIPGALKTQPCPLNYGMWAGFKASDFSRVTLTEQDRDDLESMRKNHPENIQPLVQFATRFFEQFPSDEETEISFLNLICAIISVTGGSAWFKSLPGRQSLQTPINIVYQVALIKSKDQSLPLKTAALRVILFLIHGGFFSGRPEPSKFIAFFNTFQPNPFLVNIFQDHPFLVDINLLKLQSMIALPMLLTYQEWMDQLSAINKNYFLQFFTVFRTQNEGITMCQDQFVTLLYFVLKVHPDLKIGIDHIQTLLWLFQRKALPTTQFHLLIMNILDTLLLRFDILLQLNDPSKFIDSHGVTIADGMIEILSDPIINDYDNSKELLPSFSRIFLSMSATTTSFCSTATHAIYTILQVLGIKNDFKGNRSVPILLTGVSQVFRFHGIQNIQFFQEGLNWQWLMAKMIKAKDREWKKAGARVWAFLDASKPAVEKGDRAQLQAAIASVQSKMTKGPVQLQQVFLEDSTAMYEWFRRMLCGMYPNEIRRKEAPKRVKTGQDELKKFLDSK